jgi:AcrR family transcriptional regulator
VPRTGLPLDGLISAAAALADEIGYENLTLAALAKRVGVNPSSLFKHFDGLADLRQALATKALNDHRAKLEESVMGKAGPDALRALAEQFRRQVRASPSQYTSIVRAPNPQADAHIKAAKRLLAVYQAVSASYGLTGKDATDAIRLIRSGLNGFVTLESAEGFGLPQPTDESFDILISVLDDMLSAWRDQRIGQ